jgi:NAD(P)-dependent dehydrogenase (short-subunit alcohol dehydrogenase family)
MTSWMAARDPDRGREAADALGGRFLELDVRDDANVAVAIARVATEGGGLDVLINNAGIAGPQKPVRDITVQEVEHVFATNVLGTVRVTNACLPLLERSENPVVVNLSMIGSVKSRARPLGPRRALIEGGS